MTTSLEGKKENVYFVINNENNQAKRKENGKSSFLDDCGIWESLAGTCPSTCYLLQENGDLRKTYFYKKNFCRLSRIKVSGKVEPRYTPLDPQPDVLMTQQERVLDIKYTDSVLLYMIYTRCQLSHSEPECTYTKITVKFSFYLYPFENHVYYQLINDKQIIIVIKPHVSKDKPTFIACSDKYRCVPVF